MASAKTEGVRKRKIDDDSEEHKHPAFGMASAHVVHCGGVGGGAVLFGTTLKHHQVIRLTIKTARRIRHLHTDWYHEGGELVSADMSFHQFMELLLNRNSSGVPCTIKSYKDGDRVEPPSPPFGSTAETHRQEFRKKTEDVSAELRDIEKQFGELLSGKRVGKTDLRAILSRIHLAAQEVDQNLPFVMRTFDETVERTVAEAKSEIIAFTGETLKQAGIKGLEASQAPELLLGGPDGEEA